LETNHRFRLIPHWIILEIANVAYFLLSDQSSFMTGQTISVSGGRIMLP